jgi:hypothetical protein
MNKYIIYGLKDPFTNEIRYIGKSVNGLDRPKEHFKPCNLKGNTHKINWIKSVLNRNKRPEIVIIEEYNNSEDLFAAEAFWINYYKLNGNITNCTDGYEGTLGREYSEETKRKIGEKTSLRMKGQPLPEGMKIAKEHIFINGIEFRNCSYCKENKEIKEFGWDKKQNRFQSYCKKCHNIFQKDWRKNNQQLLSQEDYNKSRLAGAKAGGAALSANPEARAIIAKKMSKPIQATNIETGEIITFESALKAKESGFQNSNIGQSIKFNKPYKGFTWKFI